MQYNRTAVLKTRNIVEELAGFRKTEKKRQRPALLEVQQNKKEEGLAGTRRQRHAHLRNWDTPPGREKAPSTCKLYFEMDQKPDRVEATVCIPPNRQRFFRVVSDHVIRKSCNDHSPLTVSIRRSLLPVASGHLMLVTILYRCPLSVPPASLQCPPSIPLVSP